MILLGLSAETLHTVWDVNLGQYVFTDYVHEL